MAFIKNVGRINTTPGLTRALRQNFCLQVVLQYSWNYTQQNALFSFYKTRLNRYSGVELEEFNSILTHCYFVTMAITNFVWATLNRVRTSWEVKCFEHFLCMEVMEV